MGRRVERLSALQVTRLKQPGYYPDGANLYLQVSATGSKSWIFRYTLDGKTRDLGLGSLATFPLADARQRAQQQRQLLADGVDPLAAKRERTLQRRMADANIITFDKAAERYIEAHAPGWRNAKHADQWRNTLATYASPVMGKLPVAHVNTALVMRAVEPIWTAKNETASRLRGRIERVLDWAKAQGYRSGDNPAAWRGNLEHQLAAPSKVGKVEHHAALPWQQMGAFMRDLRTMPGMAALALEFAILSSTRTNETLKARWCEIDLTEELWTIPEERMKAGREHRIPLSRAALDVLERARAEAPESEFVFAGRNGAPMSNMACLALLQRRMGRADLTVHGFRSAFRDWAGEATAHPREVIEHAMAHQLKDKAEAAYMRGTLLQKRRALMDDWSGYCGTVRFAADVMPIRAKVAA